MKNLQNFKKEKVDLKSANVKGGRMAWSGWLIWDMPGGGETPGNTLNWVHPD